MGFFGSFGFGKSSKNKDASPAKEQDKNAAQASSPGKAADVKELQAEVARLRAREHSMTQTISQLRMEQDGAAGAAEIAQEQMNMLDFKYQLMLDMLVMRELDAEEDQRKGPKYRVTNSVTSIG